MGWLRNLVWGDEPDDESSSGLSGDIVGECTAFLTGGYKELLERQRQEVPGWAWINPLAHGTENDLRSAAAFVGGPSCRNTGNTGGNGAVAAFAGRLARRVLVKMRSEGSTLAELQRDLLVPLELALASHFRGRPASAPELSRAASLWLASGRDSIDLIARPRREEEGESGGGSDGLVADPGESVTHVQDHDERGGQPP